MSFRVVDETAAETLYPVRPDDIDCDQSFHWAFPDLVDGPAAHEAAKAVIRLCQTAGKWVPFAGDVSSIYLSGLGEPGYVWKKGEEVPITKGWIVLGEDGLCRVTDDLILRCFGRARKHH